MTIYRVHLFLACVAILVAAVVAEALIPRTPMASQRGTFKFEELIPRQFGAWTEIPNVTVVEPPGSIAYEIYNQEFARGYTDKDGNVVMLLVAYGLNQSNGLRLHNPEICYAAQGFRVSSPKTELLHYSDRLPPIGVKRLMTRREGRIEPVTYWMRVGDDVPYRFLERQILPVKYGLRGLVPDGTLVRVSTLGPSDEGAFKIQDGFVKDLISAADAKTRSLLIGEPSRALN
jgi:EpsI family protein